MRVLGLALAGVLALSAPMMAHAVPLGSSPEPAKTGPAPGVVQVWDSSGSGWHPAPNDGAGGWHQMSGHSRQWKGGSVPPHWGPNGPHRGWGPFGGLGVPTYWVWGPSGGAFDYPFADWRGPTGGWGNP
jgi:hypothetical protein